MLRFLGEPMTEEEISSIIEEADVDNDGAIDYAEFCALMAGAQQRQKPCQRCHAVVCCIVRVVL